MTELATLGLSIRSDGVVVATDRLKDFEGAGRKAESVTGSLMRAAVAMGAALAGAFSIRAISQYADAWSDMQSRVGAAVKDMEAAPALMQRMVDLANASYSPLEQTVEVYTRNVGVLRDLGVSAAGAADFTESLNHMLVITATRGERAASVQNALSKAMATGKLQADGLETVLANGGRVAEALANELGTTVSGLRGMASQGKLTGDVIKNALLNSLEDVRAEAAEMPATIGDAFTRIQTNTMALVGTLDQAWGISGRVAEQMLGMADGIRGAADTMLRLGNIVGAVLGPAFDVLGANMDTIASLAGVAVAALAGFYAPALISGLWATSTALMTGVAGGIKAVTLAMMANPLGLLIAGLAAAVTAAFLFRDQIKQAIGIDVVAVMVDVGNKTIGVFVGAYEAVKEQWSNLPTFFSAIGKMAWNNFLESFEGPALTIDTPWGSWQSGGLDLSGAKSALTAAEQASFGQSSATFNTAFNKDYIKGIGDAVGDLWDNASGAGDAISGLAGQLGEGGAAGGEGLAGAASKANNKMKTLADDGLAKVGQFGQQVLSTLSSGFADMFKGLITGTKSAGEAISGLLSKLGDLFINQAFNMLFGGIFGGGLGGGIGGGLFGLPSFDGGGWTGDGARSGGMDGKGGYLAMVHPRERIVDTTRSGGQAGGGRTVIEVQLSPELLAQVLQEAAGQAVQITQGMVAPVSRAVDQMAQQQRYA
jgi:tape measure domain-containing protein